MKKTIRNAMWYMTFLSINILTMTILATIQGAPLWGWAVAIALLLLQIMGLSYFLRRDPKKEESTKLKLILIVLKLSALGVIAWLGLAIFSLGSQYHNMVDPLVGTDESDNIRIVCTDELYIMYPDYDDIVFVTKDRPSRKNEKITYCSGATFQENYDVRFDHTALAGKYVENGVLYEGYELEGLGAFTFYNGEYHFANAGEAEQELERAAENGGCGFQQYMIIEDGEVVLEPANEYRCFRVLAELDGRLCIIDATKQIHFHDFVRELESWGVTNAIYMDMGSGWNYSWYRNNEGDAKTLIGIPWIFSHNWLTFTKE